MPGCSLEAMIENELEQWGCWARGCPSKTLNYPSSQPFAKHSGGRGPLISEERLLLLDEVVAEIGQQDREIKTFLIDYYIRAMSIRRMVEKRCFSSNQKALSLKKVALRCVGLVLKMKLKAAA